MSIEEKTYHRPFLKWAGGKFKLIDEIKKHFPNKINKYIEPFVGAGSVAFNIDNDKIIINDINRDLFNLYCLLKKHGKSFIDDCKSLFEEQNRNKESYCSLRKEFNSISDPYRKSIIFVYLNKNCFNGLCRYNSKGEFNTPVGDFKATFPEEELYFVYEKLQNIEIFSSDFRNILEMAGKDDVVYCDPPYLPLSDTASFDKYSKDGFSLQDHIDLAKYAMRAVNRGATVLISNHYNWYALQIYTRMFNAKINTVDVRRLISAKGESRNNVKEIIAVFKG